MKQYFANYLEQSRELEIRQHLSSNDSTRSLLKELEDASCLIALTKVNDHDYGRHSILRLAAKRNYYNKLNDIYYKMIDLFTLKELNALNDTFPKDILQLRIDHDLKLERLIILIQGKAGTMSKQNLKDLFFIKLKSSVVDLKAKYKLESAQAIRNVGVFRSIAEQVAAIAKQKSKIKIVAREAAYVARFKSQFRLIAREAAARAGEREKLKLKFKLFLTEEVVFLAKLMPQIRLRLELETLKSTFKAIAQEAAVAGKSKLDRNAFRLVAQEVAGIAKVKSKFKIIATEVASIANLKSQLKLIAHEAATKAVERENLKLEFQLYIGEKVAFLLAAQLIPQFRSRVEFKTLLTYKAIAQQAAAVGKSKFRNPKNPTTGKITSVPSVPRTKWILSSILSLRNYTFNVHEQNDLDVSRFKGDDVQNLSSSGSIANRSDLNFLIATIRHTGATIYENSSPFLKNFN
eukprot:Awhi_evm1s3831